MTGGDMDYLTFETGNGMVYVVASFRYEVLSDCAVLAETDGLLNFMGKLPAEYIYLHTDFCTHCAQKLSSTMFSKRAA
jgi:hypothetical protein